jgi:uncharacterized repeat protein (TIGR01451 family)
MKQGIGRALPKIFGVLGAGVLVTGSALLMPALMQSAGATGTGTAGPPTTTHHVQPTYHTGNITTCPAGTTTFIPATTSSATYTKGGTYFDATVVTSKYVNFTTNSSSFTVYVKGGNAYDTYDYTTTAYTSDTGLHAPLVGNTANIPNLSHYLVCGQPAVVKTSSPTLTTHASGPVTLGAAIHDTATLSGGHTPTGTITFHVFSTASCRTALSSFVTHGVTVKGTGKYTSASATPTAAGTYFWTASYSGDAANSGVTAPCGAATESSVVSATTPTKATPTLTTTAGTEVALGTSIHDTATLSGGHTPTGTITFHVFSTASCRTALSTFVTHGVTVTGTGKYTSASATPTVAGTYFWTASYSGDANNAGATEPCDGAHESVLVKSSAATTGAKPELEVVKSSTPPSTSTVAPSDTVAYKLSLIDSGAGPATDVIVTDTVPTGTTYEATSATCNGISGCTVSVASGMVTWTGLDIAPGQTLAVSFKVVVNATDTNGQKIDNVAEFTNRGTPTCTTEMCSTNTVTLTVVSHTSAATSSSTPTLTSTSTSTPTPTTTPTPPSRISEASTVHTGEPWAGSLWAEMAVLGTGLSLLGLGVWLRRRHRPGHLGQ